MATPPVKKRLTSSGARLIVAVTAAGCAGLLLTLPRAVVPTGPPELVFPPSALHAVEERDQELAANAPTDDASDRLRALIREQGRAEVAEGESEESFAARREAVASVAAEVAEAGGVDAIAALRAEAVLGLDGALGGRLAREEEEEVLGSFPRMLDRYGAQADGVQVAPPLVIRSLFAARWNAIAGRALTEGFSDAELAAYWGWLALGPNDAPAQMRADALAAYALAGGPSAAEARAWDAFARGDMVQAAALYRRASEATGDLRLRNHALAAQALVE